MLKRLKNVLLPQGRAAAQKLFAARQIEPVPTGLTTVAICPVSTSASLVSFAGSVCVLASPK